jgi:hypothetical protein
MRLLANLSYICSMTRNLKFLILTCLLDLKLPVIKVKDVEGGGFFSIFNEFLFFVGFLIYCSLFCVHGTTVSSWR